MDKEDKQMKIHGLLILIFLWSCGQKTPKQESPLTDSVTADKAVNNESPKTKIILDSFTNIPDEIQGCSCFYSESEDKHLKNEYFFVAGFDSTAFISIDNKLLKLKLVSTGREPNTFGDNDHTDIYKTDDYQITLDIKYLKQEGDEGWLNTGTITIQSKDGLKEIIKFYGGCGC
ncbi:MAG: hypothetical protein JST46_18055 [Bacteroidetes bacterium]|nr:hypothetical protein [Bacteroidota bacterium]